MRAHTHTHTHTHHVHAHTRTGYTLLPAGVSLYQVAQSRELLPTVILLAHTKDPCSTHCSRAPHAGAALAVMPSWLSRTSAQGCVVLLQSGGGGGGGGGVILGEQYVYVYCM